MTPGKIPYTGNPNLHVQVCHLVSQTEDAAICFLASISINFNSYAYELTTI